MNLEGILKRVIYNQLFHCTKNSLQVEDVQTCLVLAVLAESLIKDGKMLNKVCKLLTCSQETHATLDVNVHVSAVRKKLIFTKQNSFIFIFGLWEKNMKVKLRLTRKNINKNPESCYWLAFANKPIKDCHLFSLLLIGCCSKSGDKEDCIVLWKFKFFRHKNFFPSSWTHGFYQPSEEVWGKCEAIYENIKT